MKEFSVLLEKKVEAKKRTGFLNERDGHLIEFESSSR